nr:vigilin-like isoform X2 [Cherax quadricarinatus]
MASSSQVFLKGAKENGQVSKARIQQRANDNETVNLKVYIPQKYLGIVLGAWGSKKQEFNSKFKVYINFPKNDSGSLVNCQENQGQLSGKVNKKTTVRPLNIVHIMGRKNRCEVARKALLSLVPVTIKENIAFRHHCFIAGKEGEQIKKMKAKYKVHVDVPPAEEQSDIIKITGLPANIERVREALREKVRQLEVKEMQVEMDPEYYPKIIWMKSAVISNLMDKFNVSIQFPPRGDVTKKSITITGCEENVEEAKAAISEKINKMVKDTVEIDSGMQFRPLVTVKFKKETAKAQVEPKALTKGSELFIEDTMSVAVKHHRHFISRRCEVLHQISKQNGGVKISFPWSSVQRDKVTLRGFRKNVEGAKAHILEIVNDLEEKVNLEVIIPQKYHHAVKGARGCKVLALTANFKVQIKFPKKDSSYLANTEEIKRHLNSKVNKSTTVRLQDTVCITGKRERCEAARDALINLVPITVKVRITPRFHHFITEENGKNAINMMRKYFVDILVPQVCYSRKFLMITGSPANIARAREAVREKVLQLNNDALYSKARRPFQFQVEIDPEYYPKIIDRKEAVISEIKNKYDVNIHADVEHNIITITGFKEKNVLEARETIFAKTRDFWKMVKYTIETDRQIHSCLSHGRAIKKVLEDCEVKIRFPQQYGNKNSLVIMGTPENIEMCKNCLLNLVEKYKESIIENEVMAEYIWLSHYMNMGEYRENIIEKEEYIWLSHHMDMEEYGRNIIEKEDMEEYIWLNNHRDPSMAILAVKNKQR